MKKLCFLILFLFINCVTLNDVSNYLSDKDIKMCYVFKSKYNCSIVLDSLDNLWFYEHKFIGGSISNEAFLFNIKDTCYLRRW